MVKGGVYYFLGSRTPANRSPTSINIVSVKPKLIVIVGPTASGKSELAVKLAKKINGEIISADSRQIYRWLDIGTGKVPGTWRPSLTIVLIRSYKNYSKFVYKGIPHHCIDFVPPKKTFTVAEYKKCAEAAIEDITRRGKIPILVGGTGFWIDAVVYGLNFPQVPPNPKLRKKLGEKSAEELLKILRKLDPARAKTIEQKNPRRIIRAIEIAKSLGKVPKFHRKSPYYALWIGLTSSYEASSYEASPHKTARKINLRIKQMVSGGLVQEAKKLLQRGVSRKRIKEFGFEYRAALDFIDKKISHRELQGRLVRDTTKYASRQMTWWKRNREIGWIKNDKEAERLISRFLRPT